MVYQNKLKMCDRALILGSHYLLVNYVMESLLILRDTGS